MKKIAFLLLFLSLTISANAYTDLNEDNPHYQAINYLSEENIFNGYDDGTFKSENFINRAEFLKILLLGFVDAEFPEDIESNFYDVSINDWHAKYINYSFGQGWVDGYGGGYFRPENNINLVEALKLISMVTDSTPYQEDYFIDLMENDFVDEWYMEYLYNAHLRDVITGDGNFDFYFKYIGGEEMYLDSYLTRGQAAELIYRFQYLLNEESFCFIPPEDFWQEFTEEERNLNFNYLPGWQLVYGNSQTFSLSVLVDGEKYLVNADVENLSFFDQFILSDFNTDITTVPNLFFIETALVDYDLVAIFDESEFEDVKVHYWQDGDRFYLMTMYFDDLCGIFERLVEGIFGTPDRN